MCSGERHINRLRLVDFDFPFVEPILEDVKMKLEVLRGNDWIRMDRKQPGVVRKSGDGGIISCGQIGCEY
jgi:hypothetical protein